MSNAETCLGHIREVNFIIFDCIECVHMCVYYRARVAVMEQPVGVVSLLPLCGSQKLNSGHQAWWQALLPTEPSHCSQNPLELYFPKHYILFYFHYVALTSLELMQTRLA